MSGDQITVSSTTGSQQDVEAAAQYDQDLEGRESPRSPGHIIVTSTTGTPEESAEAAGMYGDEVVATGEEAAQQAEGFITPILHTENVYTTTGTQEQNQEVQRDIDEQKEERRDRYLGRSRFDKRIDQLVRQREEARSEAEQLRQQLAQTRQPAEQPQGDQGQPPQPLPQQPYLAQQQTALEELNQVMAKLPEVEKAFAEKNPDYFEAIARVLPGRETPMSPTSYYHLLLHTPNPEACAYHLAHDDDLRNRLWSLELSGQGAQVIKDLNDLSAELQSRFTGNRAETGSRSSVRRERQPSPTPAPIRPLRGTSAASANKSLYDEGLSYQEHKALMERQERRR